LKAPEGTNSRVLVAKSRVYPATVTIHGEHPFLEPEHGRDPLRRFRGRLGGAVTLWTTGSGASRAGLTVSSVMVAAGAPAQVLGLVDPDSDLAAAVASTGTAVVALLAWEHRDLADAFAGVAPAPGGVFRLGSWTPTAWGPLLDGVSGWAGIRLHGPGRETGWSLLVEGEVEHVEVLEEGAPLLHRRGRYLRPAQDR
jgi:flavin reductase (DIM6/NTAB) family NADH-FMN oxidoreductase RutF